MSTLYQIFVEGPFLDHPYQGSFKHDVVALAYVDHFFGDEDDVVLAINKVMKPLYGSDWNEARARTCTFKLIKTPLLKDISRIMTSETREVGNFKQLCALLFHRKLLDEKAKLEKRMKEIDELLF